MDLLTAIILFGAMCMMLSSIVAGAYALLNKEASPGTTLLSAEDLEALAGSLKDAENQVQYSNVLDARIGFDSKFITKSATLSPADCQSLCMGTGGCEGFQISGQNSCDLLANVTQTYAFVEQGYNVFTVPIKVPLVAFGAPHQGEISGRDVTLSPSPAPPPQVYTKHECAERCKHGPGCKSFSVSATEGCRLKSAKDSADASIYASGDWNSYFTQDVKHSSGWSWKTPAPIPSPT